ncbi:MAG: YIP1 family protein [Bacteroidota bacterium]
MNDQPNLPVEPAPAEPIFQKWMTALTRPNETTYAAMAAAPEAKASTGYLWYFIGSLVVTLLGAAVQQPLMRNMLQQAGQNVDLGNPVAYLLCGAPIAAVISTIFFAIGTAIIQWIASLFGGRGTNNQLVYVFSNILTPYLFVSGVLTLLAAIPFVGWCFGLVSLAGVLYILVLEIMAVKGVNRIDWGPAIAAVLIPGLVILFACICLFAGLFALLYPAIRQSIPQLQQVIPQY